jgi:hypothetical protein
MIAGTGHRTAISFDGVRSSAPVLHVEFAIDPASNHAPVVEAGPNRTVTLPAQASVNGSASDDGLPGPLERQNF